MIPSRTFLLILNPDHISYNEQKILEYLHDIGHREVLPHTACEGEHEATNCLVIWRFNEKDKLSDAEVITLVGRNGFVQYRWVCPTCNVVQVKFEHPSDHSKDREFYCDCVINA
jgi:hypothetical protein